VTFSTRAATFRRCTVRFRKAEGPAARQRSGLPRVPTGSEPHFFADWDAAWCASWVVSDRRGFCCALQSRRPNGLVMRHAAEGVCRGASLKGLKTGLLHRVVDGCSAGGVRAVNAYSAKFGGPAAGHTRAGIRVHRRQDVSLDLFKCCRRRDDLEDGHRRRALRGRQGGHQGGPALALVGGAGGADAALHVSLEAADRARLDIPAPTSAPTAPSWASCCAVHGRRARAPPPARRGHRRRTRASAGSEGRVKATGQGLATASRMVRRSRNHARGSTFQFFKASATWGRTRQRSLRHGLELLAGQRRGRDDLHPNGHRRKRPRRPRLRQSEEPPRTVAGYRRRSRSPSRISGGVEADIAIPAALAARSPGRSPSA